jgi:hypothetical protein
MSTPSDEVFSLTVEEMAAGKRKQFKKPNSLTFDQMVAFTPKKDETDVRWSFSGWPALGEYWKQIKGTGKAFVDTDVEVRRQLSEAGGFGEELSIGAGATAAHAAGATKALGSALHSIGEYAVAGVASLAKTLPYLTPGGKAFKDEFSSEMERQEVENAKARQLLEKLIGTTLAPATKEEQAFHELLMLLPGGIKALGETIYEKTGWALAAAGGEGLSAFFLLKPSVAARAFGGVRRKVSGDEAQSAASTAAADRVAGAFDDLAAKNPRAASAMAEHVGKADSATGELLQKRVDQLKIAGPEQLRRIGQESAAKRLTQDTILYVRPSGEAAKGKPAPDRPVAYVGESGRTTFEQRFPSRFYEKPGIRSRRGGVVAPAVPIGPERQLTWDQKFYGEAPRPTRNVGTVADFVRQVEGKGPGQFDLEGFARRKAEKERLVGIPHDTMLLHPPKKGWFTDPGAIPGEPQWTRGRADRPSKAVIIERQDVAQNTDNSVFEAFVREGKEDRSIGLFNTPLEAANAADEALAQPRGNRLRDETRETLKLGDKMREIQIGKEPEILMAGDVGVEIAPVKGGFKLSVIRKGEITPLETFPTRNLAVAFAEELLQKQGVREKLRVVEGGRKEEPRVPVAGATPGQYPTLPSEKVPISAGFTRLYRGETTKSGSLPEWVVQGLKESGALDARGRWFTDDIKIAEWYKKEAGTGGRITFVDVPLEQAERFRVSKSTADVQRFSRDKEREFFIPRDIAEKAVVSEKARVTAEEGLANSAAEISKAVGAPKAEDLPKPGMDDPGYIDLNMGIPVRLSDLKAAFDFSRKYVPGVELAIGKSAEYWDGLMKHMAPESRGPGGKLAGAIVASAVAEARIHQSMVYGPASQKRSSYWNMHPEAAEQFIRDSEIVPRFEDPVMQKAKEGYAAWNDRLAAIEKEMGIEFEPIENYLYHIFEDGPAATRYFDRSSRGKWGLPGFTKDRVFRTYSEAQAVAGLKPKFSNPEDIMHARQHAHDIAVAKTNILRELEAEGLAVRIRKGQESAPPGFEQASRRSPSGESYWVEQTADQILTNFYDTKSLWSAKGLGGDIFRGAMFLKNSIVPVILSASGFHGIHVLTLDNIPASVRAVKEWASGAKPGSRAAADVLRALTFTEVGSFIPGSAVVSHPLGGARINNIIRGKIPESEWTASDKANLSVMMEGGFMPLQAHVHKTAALENFRRAIEKSIGAAQAKRPGDVVTQGAKTLFYTPFAMVQALQKPMFDWWIPALKSNSYLQEASTALRADPTLFQDAGRRKEVLRRIAKSVDNFYGEMAYDTLFWDKWVKDIGVATTLSLGWNLGFIREYGGAPIDVISSHLGKGRTLGPTESVLDARAKPVGPGAVRARIARGDYDKIMRIAAYTAVTLGYGGLMTYALTGEPPKELLDYTHPRIGETNPDGSEKRVNTMYYPREFVSIAKHIEQQGLAKGTWHLMASKAAPSIGMVYSWAVGMDTMGNEIRDPDGSPYRKLTQTLAHSLYELEPISVDALQQEMSQSRGKSVTLALTGFAPAAKYITATKTEAAIKNIFLEYHGAKRTPYEKAEQSSERSKARQFYQTGKMEEYYKKLDEMETRFELSPGEMKRLTNAIESDKNPVYVMFQRLHWTHQRNLMDKMTPEELDIYQPLSNKDHLRYDYIPKDQRQ